MKAHYLDSMNWIGLMGDLELVLVLLALSNLNNKRRDNSRLGFCESNNNSRFVVIIILDGNNYTFCFVGGGGLPLKQTIVPTTH